MTLDSRVRAGAKRVADLLHGADGTRKIPGMDWTVGEVGAHLVAEARLYKGYLTGVTTEVADVDALAGENARHIKEYGSTDPSKAASELVPAYDELLDTYASVGPDTVIDWHQLAKVKAADIMGIQLGELVVHGWDIAQGLGRPYRIDPADADVILTSALALAPAYVDRSKSAGLNGVIRARLRGGSTVGLRWRDGELSVEDAPERADVTVSADPVAFLLTSYGRGSKWAPILTGKVVAYGRRPLLAFSLQKALRTP